MHSWQTQDSLSFQSSSLPSPYRSLAVEDCGFSFRMRGLAENKTLSILFSSGMSEMNSDLNYCNDCCHRTPKSTVGSLSFLLNPRQFFLAFFIAPTDA
jgi:hypothetical protein